MNARAYRRQQNKSDPASNNASQKMRGGQSTFQFIDNRPEAVAQRKLQAMADSYSSQQQPMQNTPQPKKKNSQKTSSEEPSKSRTLNDKDSNQQKIEEVSILVKGLIEKCKDTEELNTMLQSVKKEYQLKFIELVDLGTPKARVCFRVNPIEEIRLPSEMVYVMTGRRTPNPITKVEHRTKTLTVGGQSSMVGTRMIASPLAPDHEPGSTSTNDNAQNGIMSMLPNAGNTAVPNDQKYIKGHLLNDHVGGQGAAYNLFPITADANAKHLAFVEKYVKSQLKAKYVVYYEIYVDDHAPHMLNPNTFYINSKFKFYWHLLSVTGNPIGNKHVGDIESTYNSVGHAPFDVTVEYAGEYDELNKGKKTPNTIGQAGQWKENTMPSPPMAFLGPTSSSSPSTYSGMSGHIGPGTSAPSLADFSSIRIKSDHLGLDYISLRNADAIGLAPGQTIIVSSGPVSITAVNPLSGGWTRVYF